jgi:hypothetical protein
MSVFTKKAYHMLLRGQINRILQIMYTNALTLGCSSDSLWVKIIEGKT